MRLSSRHRFFSELARGTHTHTALTTAAPHTSTATSNPLLTPTVPPPSPPSPPSPPTPPSSPPPSPLPPPVRHRHGAVCVTHIEYTHTPPRLPRPHAQTPGPAPRVCLMCVHVLPLECCSTDVVGIYSHQCIHSSPLPHRRQVDVPLVWRRMLLANASSRALHLHPHEIRRTPESLLVDSVFYTDLDVMFLHDVTRRDATTPRALSGRQHRRHLHRVCSG